MCFAIYTSLGEENTNLSDNGCNSFAANLPSRHIDNKKDVKFSKTTQKRMSHEIRGLRLEYKKMNETTIFLCGEEKSSDFSGEKKIKRKKSFQGQLHTKRTEIASSSVKLLKEKMTREENSLFKLPNQYSVHKTLSPFCTSSSIIRKREMISSLYKTLYNQVPQGDLYSQELSALQKACKIFSKIQSGKIYVNDLPMIHHTLKISISDSEMRKALKTIDIDAFQNALKIFCRIKSGRVATDELAAVLDSMDIPVIPETFQEVIKHASIDSNHRVDIRDIIFTLDELQHQYEDFSIMEWSGLDESPSNRKLSNISECYLQYRKKSTLSSRLFEPSLFPKLNKKTLQHYKIMEDNDYLEFKRSKNPSQIKKFLNGVDSSNTGFQEPYSKDGINFKKYSEKIEIHDSKSIPHNLKSITSLKKSLDKSDTFSIPKLQKPTVRRHSSPLKQVSLKEKATTNALENICEAISKLQENYIAAEELKSILPSIGITLSDKVFKKIVTDTTQNESGMVNLDDFMNALAIDQSLPEYDVLTDIIKAIDKIKDENMDYEDLNTCLQGFGVYLSKPEFEKITELTEANETKKANFKEFIDIMMTNTERFSEKLCIVYLRQLYFRSNLHIMYITEVVNFKDFIRALNNSDEFIECQKIEDASNIVNSVFDGKVEVKDLLSPLESVEKLLSKEKPEALLNCATDKNKKIVKDIIGVFTNSPKPSTPFNNLFKEITTLDKIRNDKMPANELSFQLLSAGIPLSNKTFQEILGQASIDENSEVSLKQILEALNTNKPAPEFQDLSTALQTVNLMDCNKIQINNLQDAFDDLNISVKPEEYQMLEKTLDVDEKGDVSLKTALLALKSNKRLQDFREVNELANALNKVTSEKVDVDEVKSILKGLGIYFPEEELQEVLISIPLDNEGKVDLKDCLTQLMKMPYFTKVSKEEGPLRALAAIRKNVVTPEDLGSIMKYIGVPLPEDVFQRSLQSVTLTEDEKVNLGEFVGNLINSGFSPLPERSRVDDSNLGTFPGNMRMEMSADKKVNKKNGIKDRRSSTAKGKTDLKTLIDTVQDITGGEVDFSELDNVLQKMGIDPSPKEHLELNKSLPVNASRNVYKNRLLTCPEDIIGLQVDDHDLDSILENMAIRLTAEELNDLTPTLPVDGEIIDVNKADAPLQNMGMSLSEKEINDLKQDLPVDVHGKVEMKKHMDGIKLFTGKKVHVSDLEKVLGSMRIELTDEELKKLRETLPIDAAGNVFQSRMLDNVKSFKGGKVKVNNLDTVLENLGIKLTQKELEGVTENLPLTANGKVELSTLMDAVTNVTGGEVNVSDIESILEKTGIELTEKECLELKKYLPVDAVGKVYQNRLKDGVKTLKGKKIDANDLLEVLGNMGIELTEKDFVKLKQTVPIDAAGKVYQNRLLDGVKSIKGGMVKVNNLDNVLENLGIELTEKEREGLTEYLPPDANGKIGLKKLMEAVETITGGEVDVSDVGNVLENIGITVTDKECGELVKNLPVNANGKVYKNRLLDGLKSLNGGIVNVNKLDSVLKTMGWKLTEDEIKDLKCNLPTDASGKVDLSKVMDGVKAVTGEKSDLNGMKTVLENVGIELKDKECLDMMKHLSKDGKVNVNDLNAILDNMGIKISDKELKVLTRNLPADGEKIDSSDLKNFLESLGIELTDKEKEKLLKTLPVNAAGKVYQNGLLKGMKSLKGGKVRANDLDNTLKKLGIELTEEELAKLSENLQIDANGMAGLKEVMDGVKATTGGEVDAKDVKTILKNMGIEFTDKECLKLMKNLPFNDDNKVFKNRLLEGVKSLKGGKVNIDNLDTILNNLGIKLADTELKDLAENMHVGVDEKIPLETLMENITDFTGEKIESSDLKNVLRNLGIEVTDKELEKMLKILPIDANGKLYRNRLLKAMKSLNDGKMKKNKLHTNLENMGMRLTEEEFAELSGQLQVDANGNVDLPNLMEAVKAITGKVDIKNLETVLGNMGIKLTDKELEDLKQNLPVSVDNKVALKTLKDEVKAFTGEKIDSSDLQNILKDMGIELTDMEHKHLLKTLPIDAHEKVFQNRLLKDVRYNKRGKVDVNNLDPVLEAMEVKLTEQELSLIKDLLSGYKKVDLKNLMDKVEAVTGEEVDINDLGTVLRNMGIELTDKELSQLVKNLPVDNGKVYQRRLLDGIKFLKGGKIDSSKVDAVLGNMGMDLTEKELKDITQNLQVDVKGKADLEKLMNEVKSFSGGKVDANKLESILENLGIELTPNERLNLVKTLPLNADGKVYQKRLMKGIKSLKQGNVDVNKLDTLLENMGISIKEKEFMDLIERLPDADKGKIKLNTLMEELSTALGEQIDVSDVYDALKDMKIEVTDKEYFNLVKTLPLDAEGKVYQKRLLDGVKTLKRGKVDMNNLDTFLENMGIKLSHKELEDFSQNLPVDVDGKVDLENVTLKMKDFTGEKIDATNLKNILGDMGIEVNDKECLDLQKSLPIDDDQKVFRNRLLSTLKSFKGG
nr:EF-hand calcium-binding domain-containing protein 13 [Mirounga angustirostris]